MNAAEKAQYIIEHTNFMTIATADEAGKPWVSPVGFVYDDQYRLYWVSSPEAQHSANIRNRSEVGISIFGQMPDGPFDGVYFDARAEEMTDEAELQAAIRLFAERRPQPDRFATHSIAQVLGNAAWRMYKATPVAIYKRADGVGADGQAITVREAVELPGCA